MKETLEQILSAENSGRIKLEQAREEAKKILKEADTKAAEILKESTAKAHAEADDILQQTEESAQKETAALKQDIDAQWHKYKDNKEIIESATDKIVGFILP